MKYTFEITIAGCATNCAHCYVDGGPARQMRFNDFEFCLQKIKAVLDKLDGDIAVTLGNEIFCHSAINNILSLTSQLIPEYFSFRDYPVPTTGIALVDRNDRERIFKNLQIAGANGCMLTIHGAEQSHNEMVCRNNAFSKLFEAADYFTEKGFSVLFNLIVSKTLCRDFKQLMQKIVSYPKAEVRLTIPLYIPIKRLRMYQANRAEYNDCIQLAEMANAYSIDTVKLLEHCGEYSEVAVLTKLRADGFNYSEEKQRAIQWKFYNITQNGDLYLGNVGAHTKWLGNLFYTEEEKLLAEIRMNEPNYDYTAYYPDDVFFSLEKKLFHIPPRMHNYVYSNKQDCIYAMLDEMGFQSSLI